MSSYVVSNSTAEEMRETPNESPRDLRGLPGNGPEYGVIKSQEHVTSLRGAQWHATALEMLRSNPTIATASREMRSFLLSAQWSIQGGRDDIAELLRSNLGIDGRSSRLADSRGNRATFESVVRSLLYALDAGFVYFEEQYAYDERMHWLRRLAWRDPRAHYRWITDADGELAGVEQWVNDAAGRFRTVEIPLNRIALAVWDGNGADYEGRGMLRPVWSHFRDQSNALQSMAVAVERAAVPAVHVQINHPALRSAVDHLGERVYTETQIDALAATIQQQMTAMRSINRSVVQTPTEDYLVLRPLAASSIDADMFEKVIRLHDHLMLRSYLAQILDLGITSSGSRSVGDVQERSAERFAVNALEWVRDTLAPTIGRLIEYNFGEVDKEDVPELVFSGVKTPEFVRRLEALPGLTSAGLLVPTEDVVAAVHRGVGLPTPNPGEAGARQSTLNRRITPADVLG